MAERLKPKKDGGLYFRPPTSLKFISSGSTLLDKMNGGGWPLGRMTNIIGDRSTGKTLLAIEAFANMHAAYPKGLKMYREGEAAFDPPYAQSIGMPIDVVDFGPKGKRWKLIEDVFADLTEKISEAKRKKQPGIYVIDSLDSLSTKLDMDREFGVQTYRTDKPTMLGELFRKLTSDIEEAQIAFLVISQVRAKIGATFGDKTTRSGGAALDFYATIINKLHHIARISSTVGGIKRVTAVTIRAQNTKNKICEAFRECQFSIRFGYGINDAASCLSWLIEVKKQSALDGLSIEKAKKLLKYLDDLDRSCLDDWSDEIKRVTSKVWDDVEASFKPKVKKYG